MSTKPNPTSAPGFAALLLCATSFLCGCQTSPPLAPVSHFGELRLGRQPPEPDMSPAAAPQPGAAIARSDASPIQRAPPSLRPRETAPVEPAPTLPVTLDTATGRVAAYLEHAGFALEQRADGDGQLVSATRMGAPTALAGEAVCGLEAMHRPDISSTDLTVRLTPTPGGVQVETTARFVEVDTKIIAGTLSRQTCRSKGVLEAAVRRAALGG